MTGAFIPVARPPACETDGPVGASVLAAGLRRAGATVRIVTDEPCAPVVAAALEAADPQLLRSLDVVPFPSPDSRRKARELADTYVRTGTTHLVAIERMGPNASGRVLSMRGQDFTDSTAPLHDLYLAGGWATIGIGDGGNEIGMGSVASDIVANSIAHGASLHCVVPCDHLIVCGVSNWGAYALLAALSLTRPDLRDPLIFHLAADRVDSVLSAAVRSGAVDGVRLVQSYSVDGVPAAFDREQLEAISFLAQADRDT